MWRTFLAAICSDYASLRLEWLYPCFIWLYKTEKHFDPFDATNGLDYLLFGMTQRYEANTVVAHTWKNHVEYQKLWWWSPDYTTRGRRKVSDMERLSSLNCTESIRLVRQTLRF
uniref:AlNc14C40G3474 protein n=1 Tax=Albugo laibachii Nc14 TaxID=890382 RepID=F0W9L9_9STRA|nr:AlNc14C40G3474 [Albugo laibachii Nc14]|eukprot:CCA17837.1 AlNc14C40G3474 [Albugo laibachii Nc14]